MTTTTPSIAAKNLRSGMTLAYHNPRQNMRVVETESARDDRIKVYADYGNGGEPATLFFDADEQVLVL